MFSHTSQAPVCCCSILRFTLRTVLFQSCHPSFIHFSLQERKWIYEKTLGPVGKKNHSLVRIIFACSIRSPTLEILSLLHWPTPLLTLTTHSTALLRACWTSSRAGTMAMLGMERVTLTLKIACWALLLPQLGESLSATGGAKNGTHEGQNTLYHFHYLMHLCHPKMLTNFRWKF